MYHHKAHHNARVKHILASHSGQGKPAPAKAPAKKRSGGSVGTSRVYARGNDSAEHMQDLPAEGHKGKSRYAKGGKVHRPLKVQINHINVGHPGMMGAGGPMPAGAPPMGGALPMAGGPGLPPQAGMPGQPPMVRNQGGRTSYGSATGMSRLAEFHKARGEGR